MSNKLYKVLFAQILLVAVSAVPLQASANSPLWKPCTKLGSKSNYSMSGIKGVLTCKKRGPFDGEAKGKWTMYWTEAGSTSARPKALTTVTTVSKACGSGISCALGEVGPGGGKVFYVSEMPFTSNGSDCGNNCHYLEAAPSDPELKIAWAFAATSCYNSGGFTLTITARGTSTTIVPATDNNDCQMNSIYELVARPGSIAIATSIGMGKANTDRIYDRITIVGGAATNTYAAGVARSYTGNGKTDWFLPSKEELNQLYINRTSVGSFSTRPYWTSSEGVDRDAWFQDLTNGFQGKLIKFSPYYVRPVRAF